MRIHGGGGVVVTANWLAGWLGVGWAWRGGLLSDFFFTGGFQSALAEELWAFEEAIEGGGEAVVI